MDRIPQRAPAFPIADLPGSLPQVNILEVDHAALASAAVKRLGSLNADHLADDAIWRDTFAFTGTLRTFYGPKCILAAWTELAKIHRPANFALIPNTSMIARYGPMTSWIEACFEFDTRGRHALKCSGIIRIVPDGGGQWKTWNVSTILEGIDEFPDVDTLEPVAVKGTQNGINGHHEISAEAMNRMGSEMTYFDCIVVGAGMSGLCMAGRLEALGVSYLVVDRNSTVGENWTGRYESVKCQMPFGRIWPSEDPYFLEGKDLARGFQNFVNRYGINVSLSTSVESASWNDEDRSWTVNLDQGGEQRSLRARHLVLAIGAGGQVPKMPEYPNRALFEGTVVHSADYKSSTQWQGKNGVVIGTGNTGKPDIQTTFNSCLTQTVIPIEYYRYFFDPMYNETTDINRQDRIFMSQPTSILHRATMASITALASADSERFDSLERAGFRVERYADLWHCVYERFGGHYLDVGASAKIVDGSIKIKGDAAPVAYTPTGLAFSDGSTLAADAVVFATGFDGNMRHAATQIVGEEIGNQLEDYWCVDAEGELRGAWKPIGHPGIWYTGGGMNQARYFSRFLALQIKADLEGMPLQPYTKTPGQSPVAML
ncbi:hypothetical protein LTR04_000461 [Oleoguttula sp. CCFEE 6159]|nr:hypothetical protein LTR04_000461 [Oleoguttula sp. CCFEE 6159]